jgi:Holliday junction resolvase RusA-like endonuclease
MVSLSPERVPPVPLLRVWVAGRPVSANRMYGARGRSGHAKRLTAAAREWRDTVAYSVLPWRVSERAPRPTLAVSCVFVGIRADADNPVKLTLDGLKIGLAVDDRHFIRVTAERRPAEWSGELGAWLTVWHLDTT